MFIVKTTLMEEYLRSEFIIVAQNYF